MPTNDYHLNRPPFHNKGDDRLMQDILTYSPTQPDAQAQADATANEQALRAEVEAHNAKAQNGAPDA